MQIFGLQKTTLLDYPGKLASIVFTAGCNMNCPFCHNSELITLPKTGRISEEEVLSHLKKRHSSLEGVVITGGECTLQNDLIDFCRKIKELDYAVKIDTNGLCPNRIKELISQKLVDYVAMDIKNSKEKYAPTCGLEKIDLNKIQDSINLLMENRVDYEFRTTVISEYHNTSDVEEIGKWLQGAKVLYLQPFKESENVRAKSFTPPSKEDMLRYRNILQKYIHHVEIRGMDL